MHTTVAQEKTRTTVAGLVAGQAVDDVYMVSDVQLRKGGRTGTFVTFVLSDVTGRVGGVFWPDEDGQSEAVMKAIEDGHAVRVVGEAVSYRDEVEVRVNAPAGEIRPFEGTEPLASELVLGSWYSEKELRDAVEVRIGLVGDKHLRRILRAFFADPTRAEAYFRFPARLEGPHSYVRGLAEEAVEASRIAAASAGSVRGLDRDLLSAAGLLAPVGVLVAMEEHGLEFRRSKQFLLPDAVLAGDLVRQAAREVSTVPGPVVERLVHVVFWGLRLAVRQEGGAQEDMLPEAAALGHILALSREVASMAGREGRAETVSN